MTVGDRFAPFGTKDFERAALIGFSESVARAEKRNVREEKNNEMEIGIALYLVYSATLTHIRNIAK